MSDYVYECDGVVVLFEVFLCVVCDLQGFVVVEVCVGSGKMWLLVMCMLCLLLVGVVLLDIFVIMFMCKVVEEMCQCLFDIFV